MSRPILIERTTVIGLAAAVVTAGLLIGAGAFLGGYAIGERSAPTEAAAQELSERIYTVDELRLALDACERADVEIDGATAVIPPLDGSEGGGCVITWLDAPGPVMVAYAVGRKGYGSTGSAQWSNVSLEWEQVGGGQREMTITVE